MSSSARKPFALRIDPARLVGHGVPPQPLDHARQVGGVEGDVVEHAGAPHRLALLRQVGLAVGRDRGAAFGDVQHVLLAAIQPGDRKSYVYETCGEPDYVDSHYERRGSQNYADVRQNNFSHNRRYHNNSFNYGKSHYQDVEVLVEEWVYDFGSSRLRKLLRFENGRLIEVENLGKRRRR
jgi:hypothetical protein